MNTAIPPNTATPTLDTLREQFATGLLTAATAAEQLGATESFRVSHQVMHEAFDQMAALANTGPRVAEISPADRLGPALPGWAVMNRTNPLVEENLPDTINLVVLHLEGIAFAVERIRGDGLPHRLGSSLAQSIYIAIAALRAHLPRP